MKFENEREKQIYERGFFAGKNSKPAKTNYTQEEIEELKCYLNAYLDALINDFAGAIDKIYRYPEWFEKIPILKGFVERKEEFIKEYAKARNFMCYVQAKSLPEYLDHINTRK